LFDIGWTEMLVVAIVAILFVGPKELPGMLRAFGKSVKKVRALAGDFQRQFDDALKDAELDGVKDAIKDVRNLDPTKAIKDKLNPLKADLDDAKKSVEGAVSLEPETLFDESKAPDVGEPVTVDVDSALERQRKIDEEFAKVAPSSGENAVPGFGGPAGKTKASKEKKSTATKPAGKKPAARRKAPAKAATSDKPARKPAAANKSASAKKTTAKTASRGKPVVKAKATTKKPVAKRKPAKKAQA
jgi:sec-independent protein translocase protein TatB